MPEVKRCGFRVWAPPFPNGDLNDECLDQREWAAIGPAMLRALTKALKASDDVELYVTGEEVYWNDEDTFLAAVFMGFTPGRQAAVPCICIDLQTIALEDLAKL